MKGIVKNFGKGYGFIFSEDLQTDVFVHYSAVEGDGYKLLCKGDEVEFEYEDTDKGYSATSVTIISKAKPVAEGDGAKFHRLLATLEKKGILSSQDTRFVLGA